ncbi:MAG: energy-coupling factor transporter ATPase [Clostridiales bacterium]|nr:energy-coupling factor transporter ATPase [Clostridiales bacterium]
MLICENVSFRYASGNADEAEHESELALKNISLHIKKGEFVAVLGHNGSGKSTLAKHFNALLLPSSGVVRVDGLNSSDEKNLWSVRQRVGMVFQNPDNQIIATVVEEDAAFGCENLGTPPDEIKRRVKEALLSVNMLEYAKESPHRLSGGQKQRVAIAGILAMRPECVVLDEPTAMLDPSGREETLDALLTLNERDGITIVLITHFMEEAVLAGRVIVMENGEIAMDGSPREVFGQAKKLRGMGLDVPQVTETCIMLRDMGTPVADDILTVDEMVDAVWQLRK